MKALCPRCLLFLKTWQSSVEQEVGVALRAQRDIPRIAEKVIAATQFCTTCTSYKSDKEFANELYTTCKSCVRKRRDLSANRRAAKKAAALSGGDHPA